MKLGVNIDHIATLRNARGQDNPNLIRALKVCQEAKIDTLTVHLREDRRHIKDKDLFELKKYSKIPINLEMALTEEMIKIASKINPKFICIVPEKRKEITTEGGLNLNYRKKFLKEVISKLKKNKSRVSLFIEPATKDVNLAKILNVDCIEFHTGKICNLINQNKKINVELNKLKKAINLANKLGIEVHAGHGLTFKSSKILSKIKGIKEFNIGHFLVGESIFIGLPNVIKKFKKILKR
jgi:pyridoxine 5-phosphate synthase